MPEASVRITKAPSGRYYTRITGQERTYYQRVDADRNNFIRAFAIPENELILIAPPDRQRNVRPHNEQQQRQQQRQRQRLS